MTTARQRSWAASPSAHQPTSQLCLGCKGDILRVDAWGIQLPGTCLQHLAPMRASTPSRSQKHSEALPGGSTNQHIQRQEQHPPKPSKHSRAQTHKGERHCLGHQQIVRVRDRTAPFPKTQKANQEAGHSSSPLHRAKSS